MTDLPLHPSSALVREYYSGEVRKEWRRLERDPYHRLEFQTTLRFLEKHLPPQGRVLDAGGGPGRYTLELARRGYDLTLLDLTPGNLEFARRRVKHAGLSRRVSAIEEGTIADLSRFADASFDAVLCLGGPFSHVLAAEERERAAAELVRVAKPGTPLFVSVMGRLSVLVVELVLMPEEIEEPHFVPMRDTGDYFGGSGFTACHFFYPEELRAVFERQPVEVLEMVGLEGVSSLRAREFNRVAKNPQRLATWMETHFQTCTHPGIVATSEHMLIVCRKV